MPRSSLEILDGFARSIELGLRPGYLDLLERLGAPHRSLPPVFHVAGTNGKGSTCAFLRSILEAAGHRVHVYTSPHLVDVHERIRLAGRLIGEARFARILEDCARLAAPGAVTVFEALTAAAFVAFVETRADFAILEVGLGGRLDATNVVDRPLASLIARISRDHRQHLGDSLAEIAREKAGIMRKDVPCFAAPQPDEETLDALRRAAREHGAPLAIGGEAWRVTPLEEGFRFEDAARKFDLPPPSLPGAHQFLNAGLAIAALSRVPDLAEKHIADGLRRAEWPARLQRLETGRLREMLPPDWDLWLDGGHNDSAGEALAGQAAAWRRKDGAAPKPLMLVCGMLSTKEPPEFLAPLAPFAESLRAVAIEHEPLSLSASALAGSARSVGIAAEPAPSLAAALAACRASSVRAARVLICGSLYLAGQVLRDNAA